MKNKKNEKIKITTSGIIPIYKKSGIGSLDISRILKRVYKFNKIGHLGTLDPMAEGVLPIMVNQGTKLANFLDENRKFYSAIMQFGIATDSDDITGNVIETKKDFTISKEELLFVLEKFKGEIEQIPPKFSAVKINGQRAYKLAREGKEFTIKAKKVTIFSLKLERFSFPYAHIRIECSRGTYIRSLIKDIGKEFDAPATMTKLIRIYASGISKDDCFSIDDVKENIEKYITPLNSIVDIPKIELNSHEYKLISNGQIPNRISITEYTKLTYNNRLVAIIYYDLENNKKRIYKIFPEDK